MIGCVVEDIIATGRLYEDDYGFKVEGCKLMKCDLKNNWLYLGS